MQHRETQIDFALAAVIALAVAPVVFEKLSIQPETPLLFRFGLVVQHGMFWDTMLDLTSSNLAGQMG